MDLIRRRKMLLMGASWTANAGKKTPIRMPATSAMKIQDVRLSFFSKAMAS